MFGSKSVLAPVREDLIRRTFDLDSVAGAKHHDVIIYLYNATRPLFRGVVFRNSKEQTIDLAVSHTKIYSPETFSQTEEDFSVAICEAVKAAWGKVGTGVDIFNFPVTVEVAPPNHYADQIEYFCTNMSEREHVVVSLYPHNGRGYATYRQKVQHLTSWRVQASQLQNWPSSVKPIEWKGVYSEMADELETLTSDLQGVIDVVTQCNDLPIHPRHPYAGELVSTAFSGSPQDTIKKGFEDQKRRRARDSANGEPQIWNMPYLPIDPADLGCTYEAVNSQSSKRGVAYLIKQHLDLDLPRKMQIAFYQVVQAIADSEAREMTVEVTTTAFRNTYYFGGLKYEGRLVLKSFNITTEPSLSPRMKTRHGTSGVISTGPSRSMVFCGLFGAMEWSYICSS
ncbi:hypothetical protein EDD15DRAFT_2478835 [Pisolithus albus]|nr:hypothetical protein EDD15DRAFT_2478835 [Pisolithus albus]